MPNFDFIESKTHLFQLVPECLSDVLDQSYFFFDGMRLKTSYLVDIIHTMVMKLNTTDENSFVLNAEILKQKYGMYYNYYMKYLCERKVINIERNYYVGVSSRTYCIEDHILDSPLLHYQNRDKTLLKKFKKHFQFRLNNNGNLPKYLKQKLVADLYNVELDYERARAFVDMLKCTKQRVYECNLYSIDAIRDKQLFYHFDEYGRLHTNYTILKSFIRKNCLLLDGEEIAEVDIPNSQPMFLSFLLREYEDMINPSELEFFNSLTQQGKFYDYMMNIYNITDRRKIKENTYRILFGRNYPLSKIDEVFRTAFPTIHKFIVDFKKENGNYKSLAYRLQREESDLIFKEVIPILLNTLGNVSVITIHDSIIIARKYQETLTNILNECLQKRIQQ